MNYILLYVIYCLCIIITYILVRFSVWLRNMTWNRGDRITLCICAVIPGVNLFLILCNIILIIKHFVYKYHIQQHITKWLDKPATW